MDPWMLQIQIEQRKVALSDMEIELKQHMDVIKVAGGINAATDKAIALQKEIKRYESRRQQASIKYNEAFTHCQKLRSQINSLRRERLVFDGIYTKLEKELQVLMLLPSLAFIAMCSCVFSYTSVTL
jgi:coiled-coil domain-containing protein 63/114